MALSFTENKEFTSAGPSLQGKTWNVFENHRWTLNEIRDIKKYVPYIELTEYKLTQSGELTSLKNNLAAIQESTLASTLAGAGAGQVIGSALGTAVGIGGAVLGAVAGGTGSYFSKFTEKVPGKLINPLSPYSNLYPSVPTGMKYTLPYLNVENMTTTAGSWQNADSAATAGAMLGTAQAGAKFFVGEDAEEATKKIGAIIKASQEVAKLSLGLANPGMAVEQIKKFTPNVEGDRVTVVFYLYNTEDINDIQSNWEFLFTLTYQNLPNRRSTNLLDPPCVYSVSVPGFKNFPIAVIEDLKVTNEGTTRIVRFKDGLMVEPGRANNDAKLVPEAYKVTLTVKSLLMNTRNIFWSAYDNNNKINVGFA